MSFFAIGFLVFSSSLFPFFSAVSFGRGRTESEITLNVVGVLVGWGGGEGWLFDFVTKLATSMCYKKMQKNEKEKERKENTQQLLKNIVILANGECLCVPECVCCCRTISGITLHNWFWPNVFFHPHHIIQRLSHLIRIRFVFHYPNVLWTNELAPRVHPDVSPRFRHQH